jgi:hypothetical protein
VKKNLKLFYHFLILFQIFHLELKKYWKSFKFFMCFFGESFLKNAKHFSPIFTLKNLKCSTSDSQQYSQIFVNDNYSHSATFEYLLFVSYSWIICISSITLHTHHLLLSTTTITFNAACHPPECQLSSSKFCPTLTGTTVFAIFPGALPKWVGRTLQFPFWNGHLGDSDFSSDYASDCQNASYKNTANFVLPWPVVFAIFPGALPNW